MLILFYVPMRGSGPKIHLFRFANVTLSCKNLTKYIGARVLNFLDIFWSYIFTPADRRYAVSPSNDNKRSIFQ